MSSIPRGRPRRIAEPLTRRPSDVLATDTSPALLSLGIFAADLTLPSGRAIVVLYVVVVILAGQQSSGRRVVISAASCILLTAVGYILRHGAHWDPAYLARRTFCALAIVITAILVIRKQMLEQQRRDRAALLDLTGDAMFVRNIHDVVTSWSRGAEQLYGWSAGEAVGCPYAGLIAPDQLSEHAAAREALLRTGRWEGEMLHRLRDGRLITVMSRWALQADQRGRALAILETSTDITESKRAEAEIRRSEERYRRIFHMTGAAIWEEDYAEVLPMISALRETGITDFTAYFRAHPDTAIAALKRVRVVDVNQTAVTLFQAASKAELMRSLDKLFLAETLDSFCILLGALASGQASCEAETVVQTLRGERRSILMSVTFPHERESITSVLVSIMDHTERTLAEEGLRLIQEELAQATRVATLGELTSSIAHDIEDPVAAIISHGRDSLRMINAAPPDLAAATRAIDLIIEEGTRAARIVIRIRDFLRKATPRHAAFDLRGTIEAAALLVRRELAHHQVALRLELADDLPDITGNGARIEHVIVHLMLNAIQAMARTRNSPHHLRVRARRLEREVVVEVEDNGSRRAEADWLFEPVFATRDDRTGRDIALAVCRATVEAHGGRIWASSPAGRGTIVQFALPVYAASAS